MGVTFLRVLVSNLLLNCVNPRRNKDTLASKELDTAFYKFQEAARIQKRGCPKVGEQNYEGELKLKISVFFVNCSV